MKALQKGFTLVEMLLAASIACVFLVSAMTVFANIGKFFEIADSQALKTERSIIYYEIFSKMASKRFIPKEYVTLAPKYGANRRMEFALKLPIQAIDVPKFIRLGSPMGWMPFMVNLRLLDPSSSGAENTLLIIRYCLRYGGSSDPNNKSSQFTLPSLKKFFFREKNIYFKPVYVGEYKHGKDRGSGWDKGDLLPFKEEIFHELVQQKKDGNVSRIYLVIK